MHKLLVARNWQFIIVIIVKTKLHENILIFDMLISLKKIKIVEKLVKKVYGENFPFIEKTYFVHTHLNCLN